MHVSGVRLDSRLRGPLAGLPTLDLRFLQGTQAEGTHRLLLALGSPAGPCSASSCLTWDAVEAPRAIVLLRGGGGISPHHGAGARWDEEGAARRHTNLLQTYW
jgi:hypothetical protein